MRAVLGSLLVLFIAAASGWGRLFNRFSPEVLSNLGYGGFGGYRPHHALPMHQQQKSPNPVDIFEQILEEEAEEEASCHGKRCSANDYCCEGHVCVDTDGLWGTCLPAFGLKQGETCTRDNDCDTGLVCGEGDNGKTCQPLVARKQYSEECSMSSECDITRGLCCLIQRRHRQQPRKVCSYFKDPLICVGPVAVDQIREHVEHTAGEKRITGKTGKISNFNFMHR